MICLDTVLVKICVRKIGYMQFKVDVRIFPKDHFSGYYHVDTTWFSSVS